MKKEELSKYVTYKKRVEKLCGDIAELEERDIETVSGKVKGSMKEHPYTERRFSVQMHVPEEEERIQQIIWKKKQEVEELEARMREIEQFIDGIEDVYMKSIFEYRYLEGMTQAETGKKMGLDRSRISRKIDNFLKTHTKHKKSMI